MIAAWNPAFVLHIGEGSVTTDLCAGFTTVATPPMTFGFPRSTGTLPIVVGGHRREQTSAKGTSDSSGLEVTAGFVAELARLVENVPGIYVVFAREFSKYGEVMRGHAKLRGLSLAVGYPADLLAPYKVCDGYLNRTRAGGVQRRGAGDVPPVAGEAFQYP